MPDAVKVGFVPFSSAPRGILVVFCDDTLKFGSATTKALGPVAGMIKRVAAANQFKGKSGSTLDFLAPEGLKASRLIVVGTGKGSDLKANDFLKLGGAAAGKLRSGAEAVTILRRAADRDHEARTGGRRCFRRAAARLQIRPLQDQEEGRRRLSSQR